MFVYRNDNPRGNLTAEDCVVRAISIVTGDSWSKVYTRMKYERFLNDLR